MARSAMIYRMDTSKCPGSAMTYMMDTQGQGWRSKDNIAPKLGTLNILFAKTTFASIFTNKLIKHLGATQVLHNAVGGGSVKFPGKKSYEGVRFNVISVMRGLVGVKFPGKSIT